MLDSKTSKVLFGKQEKERREVASLTKIMTFYTIIKLQESLNIDLETLIAVSDQDCEVEGTSAMLESGDLLSIEQLLYGLMLPSGNDSAHCLASWFGA